MDKRTGWKIASLALCVLAALLALHLAWALFGAGRASTPKTGVLSGTPEPFRWPAVNGGWWKVFRSGAPSVPTASKGALSSRYRLAGAFLVLSGTDRTGEPIRCAILDDLQEKQQSLAMEGEWVGQVRVVRVESDHVVLSDGEREEMIVLAAGTLPGTKQSGPPGVVAPPAPTVLETNRFGNRIGETRWEIRREAVMEYYQEVMDDPERLASLFMAMDATRGANGRVDGHRLNMEVGEKEFYSLVGFQDGDVIRRANSMRMTSQRRAEYFIGEFVQGRLDTVVIDIERNGERKKLIYLVK